jgi:hypothetical protein
MESRLAAILSLYRDKFNEYRALVEIGRTLELLVFKEEELPEIREIYLRGDIKELNLWLKKRRHVVGK